MTAVNLAAPAIAHFDLAVAGRCAVPNHEVVGQSILHMPNVFMVVVENFCISLTRAAVVHHDKLPLRISPIRWRAIDLRPDRARQVSIPGAAPTLSAAVEETVPKPRPL